MSVLDEVGVHAQVEGAELELAEFTLVGQEVMESFFDLMGSVLGVPGVLVLLE